MLRGDVRSVVERHVHTVQCVSSIDVMRQPLMSLGNGGARGGSGRTIDQRDGVDVADPVAVVAGRQGTTDIKADDDSLERLGEVQDDGRCGQSGIHGLRVSTPSQWL